MSPQYQGASSSVFGGGPESISGKSSDESYRLKLEGRVMDGGTATGEATSF